MTLQNLAAFSLDANEDDWELFKYTSKLFIDKVINILLFIKNILIDIPIKIITKFFLASSKILPFTNKNVYDTTTEAMNNSIDHGWFTIKGIAITILIVFGIIAVLHSLYTDLISKISGENQNQNNSRSQQRQRGNQQSNQTRGSRGPRENQQTPRNRQSPRGRR